MNGVYKQTKDFTRRAMVGLVLAGCLLLSGIVAAATIEVSAELSEARPFARQSTVYTVRILTDQALETADVTLPRVSGGVFSPLDDEWTLHTLPGQQGNYVNERRYLFTPLRPGHLEIPPATVKVVVARAPQSYGQPWGQQSYGYPNYGYPGYGQQPVQPQPGGSDRQELQTAPLRLEVTGLVGEAATLLPLHDLRIEGKLQAAGKPREGEPVAVGITLTAVGATGDALPGIVELLQAGDRAHDFKIYAERPQTTTRFDERLRAVVGQRIETVTLVPTRSGAMQLPIVEIPYWNVITGGKDVARLATRPLHVEPGAAGTAPPRASRKPVPEGEKRVPLRTGSEDVRGFWLPVGGALLAAFFIGWRIGSGQRRQRRALAAAEGRADAPTAPSPSPLEALGPVASRAKQAVTGVMPGRVKEQVASGTGVVLRGINRIIPRRLRIWSCMHCVTKQDEPLGICRILRRFASDCLGMPENSSIESIGREVARRRPSAETSAYLNLFGRLDDAAYGNGGGRFDVEAWKRDFRKMFGRLLRRSGGSGRPRPDNRLPELNPR